MARILGSITVERLVQGTQQEGDKRSTSLVRSAHPSERRVPGVCEASGIAMCCGRQDLASFQLGSRVEQDERVGNSER